MRLVESVDFIFGISIYALPQSLGAVELVPQQIWSPIIVLKHPGRGVRGCGLAGNGFVGRLFYNCLPLSCSLKIFITHTAFAD